MNGHDTGLPIEMFIQAITSQLDRAQATMAMKARAGMPLTFAVKDLSIDLRTHIDMSGSVVRIRPAGPADAAASTIHLNLTTITRPMIEENTAALETDPDEPSLREVLGDELSEDEERRLEWAGVRSVSQLRRLQQRSTTEDLRRVTQLPASRLQAALSRAAQPRIHRVLREHLHPADDRRDASPLLRVRGRNLLKAGQPQVRIGGERVAVIRAAEDELLVAPLAHQLQGTLSVEVEPGITTAMSFDVSQDDERVEPTAAVETPRAGERLPAASTNPPDAAGPATNGTGEGAS